MDNNNFQLLTINYQLLNVHCHLYNFPDIERLLKDKNRIYVSNALDENELDFHLKLMNLQKQEAYDTNLFTTTGQHPLYPKNAISETKVIELLEKKLLFAVGEIGLDKRCKDFEWQKKVFLSFLDIANQFHKPVIIHCVGYYYELLSIIKKNFPSLTYILHYYQGSLEMVHEFSKLNTIFSLHKNIIKIRNSKKIIKEIVEKHNFAFETDTNTDDEHDIMPTIKIIDSVVGDRN